MSHVRLAGLRTLADAPCVRVRRLPVAGDVLVGAGQRVASGTLLGRDRSEQNLHVLRLDTEQQQIQATLLKKVGDPVKRGEPVAYQTYLFGLGYREYVAPVDGTVVDIQPANGFVVIRQHPEDVPAYLPGLVVRVLPGEAAWVACRGALVEGAHGSGGPTAGPLRVLEATAAAGGGQPITPAMIDAGVAGQVVVGRGWVEEAALLECLRWRARAVVCGGIERAVLRRFEAYIAGLTREELEARFYAPGTQPAEAGAGSEAAGAPVRLTVVVTEGFGRWAMRPPAWELLRAAAGREAYVAGPDPVGGTRAEVIIPAADPADLPDVEALLPDPPSAGAPAKAIFAAAAVDPRAAVEEGAPVRVLAGPAAGRWGRVVDPAARVELETGQAVPAAVVELEGGERRSVPRPNLERLW